MAADISGMLNALKAWQKAVRRLRKKGQSLQSQEAILAQTRQSVLVFLEDAQIQAAVDALVQQAIAPSSLTAADLQNQLKRQPAPIVTTELQTLRSLAVSRKQLEQLLDQFLQLSTDTADEQAETLDCPLENTQEIKDHFLTLSVVIPQAYKEAASLSRKQKKARKRDLTLGTLNMTIGIGLLAGNTQLDTAIANASYILGGNALITALHNLIGQVETPTAAIGSTDPAVDSSKAALRAGTGVD